MSRPPTSAAERESRYEAVFTEVYEPLQRYVRRRAAAHEVDDVVADVLLVVWRRLDDVPADAELPWCYGVASRTLANHRRSADRALRLVHRIGSEPTEPRPDQMTTGAGTDHGLDDELTAAIARLGPADQELVRLWAWEGLAPREIGVAMGTSANAASVRLHRVRTKLADELRKDPARPRHLPHDGARARGTTSEEGTP